LDGAGGGEGPSDPAGAVAPPAAAPAQTPAGPDPPAADAVPSLAEAPAPETAPEPASEPPPPEPGRVVVARSWSPEIYVSVDGGPRHRLDGERSFQVPPGQITVRFTYRDGEYSDSAQTRVTVGEGKTVRPAMPLQRPGSLRVQPFVNTPPGEVFLDGAPLGRSPVTVAHVRPGPHQLRIERQGPAGQEVIEAQVEIASGTLHTATFDLGRGQLVNVHPRPLD
ncbi:MAG TPA: PEGA domain-containing protein, partial [Thermoanaerobaculia bacterium]|nr:PEGA domain-containing protein [Thermoanaerobaculia bacterium]